MGGITALLAAKVKPGSKKSGVSAEGVSLVLRVRERAVDGAANEACVRVLSGLLGIPASRVVLVRGARSREKRFAIEGLDEVQIWQRLGLDAPRGV
jgi:uncharacterized protein YggU (UPF0235/DUF167 family)